MSNINTFEELFQSCKKITTNSLDYHKYFDKYSGSNIKIFNTHNRVIDDRGFKVKFEEKTHNFEIYYGKKPDGDGCYTYKTIYNTNSAQEIYNIIKSIK